MSLIRRLYVNVLEARGLLPTNASEGAYVKLRAGNHKARTKAVKGRGCFVWNEEFVFRVEKNEEIEVRVLCEAGCGVDEEQLIGCVRVPFCKILDGGKKTPPPPPPTWFSLEGKHLGHAGSKTEFSGSILLTALLYGRSDKNILVRTDSHVCIDDCYEQPTKPVVSPIMNIENLKSLAGETEFEETPPDHEDQRFIHEKGEATTSVSKDCNSPGFMCGLHHDESIADVNPPSTFEELIGIMQSRDNTEMPENLQGGVLVDQIYMIEPHILNSLLFQPNSIFRRDLTEVEGTCDYQEGPWTWNSKDIPCLRRSVSCTKAATKLIKAVKAIEEQSYLKADGKNFAVLTRTRTPDVPYGDCFEVDLMYRISPIRQLPSCDESTRLVISWNIVFCHSTVMKGMIVGTARQGLKESYEIFANLLAKHIRPAISSSGVLDKNHLLAPLELFHQSDWLCATKYFLNFTVFFAICIWTYVLVHILLSRSRIHCLEFSGIDLPDTLGEIFISGILILQGERVFHMIVHFIRARWQRGSDHGVKAQGDGWLLTVALIGGNNLPATASGQSDPYVVFSCNGRTRTSSVQLQTLDPQWNEILEFDAMEEPPAVLDVEVFDFDGPFDLEFSLGHAEINFLKHTSDELADLWAPLEGELAQISQSKLHLKIFLENTKGVETVKDYLTKMEKEVGKKLKPRSTQKNSTFQEIFSLPPEEFLIKDFSCYLKRKLPLQGRIFISARIVGFYSNFFGYKTKFFFLWEDIEDIQVIPPSFATVRTPALLMILRSGRGFDARHGAKCQDDEGRLNFQFQSIASFSIANKTIKVLWRTKTTSYEDRAKLEEDELEQDGRKNKNEDSESLSSNEDTTSLSNAFSKELPVAMELLIKVFEGGELEKKIMENVGCLNYSTTEWKETKPDIHDRLLHYKFNRYLSIFGGEVNSTQDRTPNADGNGWVINETMALHGIPFSDNFQINLKYKLEALQSMPPSCQVDVFICITWLKRTKFRKRITRNIFKKLAHRSKEVFELCEKEIMPV